MTKRKWPSLSSTLSPKMNRYSMFEAMCSKPPCRNMLVNSVVSGEPSGGGGPTRVPGCVNSTGTTPADRNRLSSAAVLPKPSSNTNATTFSSRMASITHGKLRRGSPGSSLTGIIAVDPPYTSRSSGQDPIRSPTAHERIRTRAVAQRRLVLAWWRGKDDAERGLAVPRGGHHANGFGGRRQHDHRLRSGRAEAPDVGQPGRRAARVARPQGQPDRHARLRRLLRRGLRGGARRR